MERKVAYQESEVKVSKDKFGYDALGGEGEFVKKQQCKKATRICKLNSFSDKSQRWKLGYDKKLKNNEGIWKSDDLWIFKTKGTIQIKQQGKKSTTIFIGEKSTWTII